VVADDTRLRWAILMSILLHALVVMSISALRNVRLSLPAPPATIDVDLASLPPPALKAPAVAPQPKAGPVPKAEPSKLAAGSDAETTDRHAARRRRGEAARYRVPQRPRPAVEQQSVRRGEPAPEPEARLRASEPRNR
jgi:hypothetical protein